MTNDKNDDEALPFRVVQETLRRKVSQKTPAAGRAFLFRFLAKERLSVAEEEFFT